ncbi:hypothetical protein OG785_16740 [Streptomyces sp. NBC_00006]|uniref:hypothetical protein n=1 Tax=Streptomyces sp. NBC_00006 TaxID=2975619 RepID=UPI002254589B|nr:hypothetical protein [Streptomyces sp. NBC_00006]MCX5532212.1 hypothetical protein [Streptomyces sp. NBC_00006]
MTSNPADLTAADYLDAAREMAATGRPYLAHLLADTAAEQTADLAVAQTIRAQYPKPSHRED